MSFVITSGPRPLGAGTRLYASIGEARLHAQTLADRTRRSATIWARVRGRADVRLEVVAPRPCPDITRTPPANDNHVTLAAE